MNAFEKLGAQEKWYSCKNWRNRYDTSVVVATKDGVRILSVYSGMAEIPWHNLLLVAKKYLLE